MNYKLIKSYVEAEGVLTKTYGISTGDTRIYDISCNKNEVLHLIKLFNDNNLSPIHLYNAVEDFMEACQ